VAPLLVAAKQHLADEANYDREGAQISRFAALFTDDPDVVVPRLDTEFTTGNVLAMSFVEGVPIEALGTAPQTTRDVVMTRLICIVLRELFEFGVMQTDPNFANYRYQPDTKRLVLLDFGAVRDVAAATVQSYRRLLQAGLDEDRLGVRDAAVAAGFLGPGAVASHSKGVDEMIDIILREMHRPGPLDFADRGFVDGLRDCGQKIAADKSAWHIPPADILFVQRKVSGTALLAARLRARVEVRALAHAGLR